MSQGAHNAQYWIDHLGLLPHPEGGYYRQTYAADATFLPSSLPSGFDGSRAASTAIYFLLTKDDFSAFHRLRSDEVWHFYTGDAVEVLVLDVATEGGLRTILLGNGTEKDQEFQAVVKAGLWFASRLLRGGSFALVGCTVSPGFHFDDFQLASRDELIAAYPEHHEVIQQLTRKN